MTTREVVNSQHALDWAVIGWLGEPGTQIFWSTHSQWTAFQAFHRISDVLLGHAPAMTLAVEKIYRANGKEEICLQNGSRIVFRSRVLQSHRGFSAHKLVLDDAYALTDDALGSLVPTVAAARNAEIVYAQTRKAVR